jgi:hypothetical protein
MTKEELAALLNGREYREEMTREEDRAARDAGLLVAFGASDDLLEFRGAVNDECGAYEGCEAGIDPRGDIMERRDDHDELVSEGWTPPKALLTVTAEWSPAEPKGASWLITADAPFAPFDIIEDGELYCRGCVVDFRALRERNAGE